MGKGIKKFIHEKLITNLKKKKNLEDEESLEEENIPLPTHTTSGIKIVQPYRHRREKTKDVLSKGQKRRLLKKAKIHSKINLDDTIEKLKNQSKIKKIKKIEEGNFLFKKIDNELLDIINQEEKMLQENKLPKLNKQKEKNGKVNKKTTSSNVSYKKEHSILSQPKTSNKKSKINRIIDEEKEKIVNVLANKTFQENPLIAIKNHIQQSQFLENNKIKSNEVYYSSMNKLKKNKK